MRPLRVGVLAYPGCFASEVFGVPDLLTVATHVAASTISPGPGYVIEVVSPRRHVVASGGVPIAVTPVRPVDVLVVPGLEIAPDLDLDTVLRSLTPELAAIRSCSDGSTAVVSICVGAFLLGDAGLLDGRRATTSWLYAERLARRQPATEVVADQLVVTDRGVTTTAGYSAMFDFALSLIGEHDGGDVARLAARITLIDDARSSQTPYVDTSLVPAPVGDDLTRRARTLLAGSLADRYDLDTLAAALNVSPRTLLRRFRAETGHTPLEHRQIARVRHARRLLETTDRSVAAIAAEVGYRDPGSLTALFLRHTGTRPRDYRAKFRRRGCSGTHSEAARAAQLIAADHEASSGSTRAVGESGSTV